MIDKKTENNNAQKKYLMAKNLKVTLPTINILIRS